MADNIALRVTRIVSGSAHALLDAVEDAAPEATMMAGDPRGRPGHRRGAHRARRVEAAKHIVTAQLNKLNTENEQLSDQVEIGDDSRTGEDLARAGLEKHINIEDQVPSCRRALAEQQEQARARRLHHRAAGEEARDAAGAAGLHRMARAAGLAAGTRPAPPARAWRSRRQRELRSTACCSARPDSAGSVPHVTTDAAKLKELQELAAQEPHRRAARPAQGDTRQISASPAPSELAMSFPRARNAAPFLVAMLVLLAHRGGGGLRPRWSASSASHWLDSLLTLGTRRRRCRRSTSAYDSSRSAGCMSARCRCWGPVIMFLPAFAIGLSRSTSWCHAPVRLVPAEQLGAPIAFVAGLPVVRACTGALAR